MRIDRGRLAGFTVVELLVVIVIISVLVTLLIPTMIRTRDAARRINCLNNLKQIGLALQNYHDQHEVMPPGWIGVNSSGQADVRGGNGFGWGAMLLPFCDQQPLFSVADWEQPVSSQANDRLRLTELVTYRCPSDPGPPVWQLKTPGGAGMASRLSAANYIGMFGTNDLQACGGLLPGRQGLGDGVFYHNSSTRLADITDGVTHTVLIGERRSTPPDPHQDRWYSTWVGVIPEGAGPYARVLGTAELVHNDPQGFPVGFSSPHRNGTSFVFAGGRVEFVSNSIDRSVFRAQATRAGNDRFGH